MNTLCRLSILALAAVASATGATLAAPFEVVSRVSRPGTTGAGPSFLPALSSDGGVVAFVSSAGNLVTNDNRLPHLDVFVRNLTNGVTKLVSATYSGTGGGAGESVLTGLSPDGRRVVFVSAGDDLVAGDTNQTGDVFVHDLATGETRMVSVSTNGFTGARLGAESAVISGDGRWVAFESCSPDLVALNLSKTLKILDVFVRDVWSNTTVLVSVSANGDDGGNKSSSSPVLSRDGGRVAFASQATNLVAGVTNTRGEIYVRDLRSNATYWVSAGVASLLHGSTAYRAGDPVLSDDGNAVAFVASNLLCWVNVDSGETRIVAQWPSSPETPDFRPALSADGRWVAYQEGGNVWVADTMAGTKTLANLDLDGLMPLDGESYAPLLSKDGQRVVFFSSSTGLVTNKVNGRQQIYLRDLAAYTTRLVSVNDSGAGANADLFPGAVTWSEDGATVAFDALASDLAQGDWNGASDVFVRDLSHDTTRVVSERVATVPASTGFGQATLSPDCVSSNGQVVLFRSTDNSFADEDTNNWDDLFLWSQASNSVVPAVPESYAASAASLPLSRFVALSANGRFIAWSPAGSPPLSIYRRDLQTGETELVTSYATPYTAYNRVPSLFTLSPDGSRIAYERVDPLPIHLGTNQVYLRDLEAGTESQISSNWWTANFGPQFSPDGRWLLYLGSDSTRTHVHLYGCDLSSGRSFLMTTNLPYEYSSTVAEGFAFDVSSEWVAFRVSAAYKRVDIRPLQGLATNTSVCRECWSPALGAQGSVVSYWRKIEVSDTPFALFVQDLRTGTEELVSGTRHERAYDWDRLPTAITPDGRHVVFSQLPGTAVPNDTNRVSDVFVYDRLLKTTTCLSINANGVPANGPSANPILSADGRTVVFQSTATDLVFGDYSPQRDIFAVRIGQEDTDADGLDDDWEFTYFDDLTHDGSEDADGDGMTNFEEFLAGTDPTNAGQFLRATTVVPLGGGKVAVMWEAVPGRSYRVQYKNAVTDPAWAELPDTCLALTVSGIFTDTTAGVRPQRIYRVRVAP